MLKHIMLMAALLTTGHQVDSCSLPQQSSASGVEATSVAVPTQSNGLTVEQQNVRDRLIMDNKPGSIKHLYVISAMSGDVLLYSTVRGKVTSSGKRLSPYAINGYEGGGFAVPGLSNGQYTVRTTEVLEDDGTYGSSIDYLYWWDAKGVYHQQYVTGGEIIHISDQPLRVSKVLINLSPATQ
jgi:hypothetical protein